MSFFECRGCRCLVKAADAVCPFCGADGNERPGSEIGRAGSHVSRAAWLAVVSTVATFAALANGCARREADTKEADVDGAAAVDPDSGASDGSATRPPCPILDTGPTACGSNQCEVTTEYCDRVVTYHLVRSGNDCSVEQSESATCKDRRDVTMQRCCVTCDCLLSRTSPEELTKTACTGDTGGPLIVTHTPQSPNIPFCGACYGAPPARLERHARLVA
ncbi:MAG: hypothetical protein JWP87_1110 [Labilithrix sp.]|nr:hypothetical protein [Labilithrix sp.]